MSLDKGTTPDDLTRETANEVNKENQVEAPSQKPTPKIITQESDDTDMCGTVLVQEKNKSFTLAKHGQPSECRLHPERKLEFMNPNGTLEKRVDPNSKRVYEFYEFKACNSACSHFHCDKDGDGNAIVTLTCGNSESGYIIPKDKINIYTELEIVAGDKTLTDRLKDTQKKTNLSIHK